jgi:hypothetical protein
MIRDQNWVLSSAPSASSTDVTGAYLSAPDDAPRRLAVIDSPVPAGASLPGTIGYRLNYSCGQGNGANATDPTSVITVPKDSGPPKWAIWVPVTAAGLFIVDWIATRRHRR